jgi:hypothetical protein
MLTIRVTVDPIPTFAPSPGWHFADVGIMGPSANIGFLWSLGFDIRFLTGG